MRATLVFFYQNKDITEIENKEFANECEWFVDNKLRINFDEDKTKCILRSENLPELNITHNNKM